MRVAAASGPCIVDVPAALHPPVSAIEEQSLSKVGIERLETRWQARPKRKLCNRQSCDDPGNTQMHSPYFTMCAMCVSGAGLSSKQTSWQTGKACGDGNRRASRRRHLAVAKHHVHHNAASNT